MACLLRAGVRTVIPCIPSVHSMKCPSDQFFGEEFSGELPFVLGTRPALVIVLEVRRSFRE